RIAEGWPVNGGGFARVAARFTRSRRVLSVLLTPRRQHGVVFSKRLTLQLLWLSDCSSCVSAGACTVPLY
ncbi:MAG: hypothetical protein ACLGHE_07540, partial [Gammaproteobacteria bacterium]